MRDSWSCAGRVTDCRPRTLERPRLIVPKLHRSPSFSRSAALWIFVILFGGCAARETHRLQRAYGGKAVREREVSTLALDAVDYWTEVQPIFAARCVVCHACYDAPCQLKLGSLEGIDRGGSKDKVYDATRLRQADPTRLFEDAQTTAGWRDKDFHPVLNERSQTPEANREAGLVLQLLDLKRAHPLTPGGLLPADIDLKLRRDEKCPTAEQLPRHIMKHPDWGMPYGMPGLSEAEHDVVRRWLEQGALHLAPPALPDAATAQVARWEALLNGDALRARLASRYIYEHLFLAHVYFEDPSGDQAPQFFELVRSRSAPGLPIERIATRRPYDDPGVDRPYYRIQPVQETVVSKLHLPYRLDAARMKRWRALLFDADFEVIALPSYDVDVASNPFVSFRAIPVPSRYRFMLDEAEFTLMGFIKGAVCRGPIALNVIDDQFWVFFVDPDVNALVYDAEFLHRNAASLAMPARAGSTAPPMMTWLRDAVRQKRYMTAKRGAIRVKAQNSSGLTLDALWDGDGHNPNAVLTVFRHFDSASVVRGMIGDAPKTAWVIDYPVLERIHYLLVAGFDVFGNVGHQLATRSYMDFLRMESEFSFLALLPETARREERDHWYRDTNLRIFNEVVGQVSDLAIDSGIRYRTSTPKRELYAMLATRYASLDEGRFAIDASGIPNEIAGPLQHLAQVRGLPVSRLPEVAFVLVPDAPPQASVFTLIHNDAHLNISSPLNEKNRRAPSEDTLTVARGLIGTYPNALFVVPRAQLGAFVAQLETLRSEADYAAVQTRFGVRRTDPAFWATSDTLHAWYRASSPVDNGVLDLSRIENR